MDDVGMELDGLLGFAEAFEGKASEVWGDVAGTCGDGSYGRVENSLARATAHAKRAKECVQEAVSAHSCEAGTARDELGKALDGCRGLLRQGHATRGVCDVATHIRRALGMIEGDGER